MYYIIIGIIFLIIDAALKEKISKFITKAPLYKKLNISDSDLKLNMLHHLSFNFHYKFDKEIKTFELEIYPYQIEDDSVFREGNRYYNYGHEIG
jgi:hypothetical protein